MFGQFRGEQGGGLEWLLAHTRKQVSAKQKIREVGGKRQLKSVWPRYTSSKSSTSPFMGPDNHMRLTCLQATGSIDMFDYGVVHRGASLRISQK